jgi:CRP-like cAMP-binding protein
VLSAVSGADRDLLLEGARRRRYAKGEVIFHEGDPGDVFYLVVRGRVAVRVSTLFGDRTMLRLINSGGWFGELSAISPDTRSATIVALEPTETLVVSADRVREVRRRVPTFDGLLVEALVTEVRRLSAALLEALFVPVDTRLFRRLAELAELYRDESSGRTLIPLTQEELAQLVGTTRPTVNKHLRQAAADGELVMGRGSVEIIDGAGVARRAR